MTVPITGGEPLLRTAEREAASSSHATRSRSPTSATRPGQQVAGPRIHHKHTDAFCALDRELTFEIGRETKTITVAAGGFLVARHRR